MTKRIITVILCSTIILAVAGCSSEDKIADNTNQITYTIPSVDISEDSKNSSEVEKIETDETQSIKSDIGNYESVTPYHIKIIENDEVFNVDIPSKATTLHAERIKLFYAEESINQENSLSSNFTKIVEPRKTVLLAGTTEKNMGRYSFGFVNPSSEESTLEDCSLYYVTINGNIPGDFDFEGINKTSTREDVIRVFGDPNESFDLPEYDATAIAYTTYLNDLEMYLVFAFKDNSILYINVRDDAAHNIKKLDD